MHQRGYGIRALVYIFYLFLTPIFFCFCSLLGIDYSGAEDSNLFKYVYIAADAIVVVLFLQSVFVKGGRISLRVLLVFLVLLIISVDYLFSQGTTLQAYIFRTFIAESVIAAFIAIDVSGRQLLMSMVKWLDVVMLLISIFAAINIPRLLVGMAIGVGEMVQALAYFSAVGFSINFFLLLFGKNYQRFSFASSSVYQIICSILLVVQIVSCLVSGGRGGAVLLIVSFFVLLFLWSKNNSGSKNKFLVYSIIVLGLLIVPFILPNNISSMINSGMERTFSYLNDGGIDMSQTSNRDIFYTESIKIIEEKNVLGWGFWGYISRANLIPHNLFLETMLQGGIIYTFFVSVFLIALFIKLIRAVRRDSRYIVIVTIALYPFVQLMFSGSYIMTPLFWFVTVLLFIDPLRRMNKNSYE